MAGLTDDERDKILISMNEGIKEMRAEMREMGSKIDLRPDRDEVREIFRDELENVLSDETFHLTRVK